MFRIAVCDDNPLETEIILAFLKKYQITRPGIDITIQNFCSGTELLENLHTGQIYDLFLLDVVMPGINGIELAGKLREDNPDVPVVFLTGSADYALPAFKVSAVQYLLKPLTEGELFSVLDRVMSLRRQEREKYFVFSAPERILRVSYSSIVFIEITGHVMRVYIKNVGAVLSKSIKVPFRTAIAPLLEDIRFLYAHKSYLINMEHVEELSGKSFVMAGGYAVPIPKYKIAEAKEKYFMYLARCGSARLNGDKK